MSGSPRSTIDSREKLMRKFLTPSQTGKFRAPRERNAIALKLQSLPDAETYASNHVMINRERVIFGLPQLNRSSVLDEIAQSHAKSMAKEKQIIFRLDEENLFRLRLEFDSRTAFALNVSCGENVREVYGSFMKSSVPRSNILNSDIEIMGVGSALDSDDCSFVCQIFVVGSDFSSN